MAVSLPKPAAVPQRLLKLLDLPEVDVSGIDDPEKKMRAALAQIMAGLHGQMPDALRAAQLKKPELVVQFYRDLIEFLAPKLSRMEQSGTLQHQVQHFVAVEEREVDPRAPAIELKETAPAIFEVPILQPVFDEQAGP